MTIKEQFTKIKENWLIVLIVSIVLGFAFFQGTAPLAKLSAMSENLADVGGSYAKSMAPSYYPREESFAPEVKDRLITKTATLSSEVERGTFSQAEIKVKSIIKSSDSYLLNENVNTYDTGRRSYKNGYYNIKVDSKKYDSVILQLKEIGEVKSFNENAEDITGAYTDLKVELEAEKERLKRYQSMYDEAKEISNKIDLSDRIFNQERTIKYLEDNVKNMDNRVSYSTIYLTINEKRSEYADVIFVKISELIKSFVGSINLLLRTVFIIAPWAVAIGIILFVKGLFKKNKKGK